MKVGDIVQWTAPGCDPETGVVLELTSTQVYLRNPRYAFQRNLSDGVFTVVPDDIQFVAGVIKTMKEIEVSAKTKTVAKAKSKKVVKKSVEPKSGSKMATAIDLYKSHPSSDRKTMIKLFVDKAGLTPAGANTYLSLVRKKLKAK